MTSDNQTAHICRVDQLARDTLAACREIERRNLKPVKPIIFVGTIELLSIRYVADYTKYQRIGEFDEQFMGCPLIGVKLPSYFNVCVGIERG